jgi:HD domain
MHSSAPLIDFSNANPHALAVILDASETKSIIASRDIFDMAGTKLWAREQPVSQALQRKLLDRQLRNPLETCLMAEDGVTPHSLVLCTEALLERDTPLIALLRPHASRIVHEAAYLPLHSVVQLLLTASQASRAACFDHAVQAMALCGSLMLAQGGSTVEVRAAMLAGLLHDLGEMYIDPQYGEADAERELDALSYRQLVVHPHIGQLLLRQLTDYPVSLARAVAEHHERLDGSGYPHSLQGDAVSPLGRLLAVAEATLGSLRAAGGGGLRRASIALRVVPGEFDLKWVGAVSLGARAAPRPQARLDSNALQERMACFDDALQAAQDRLGVLAISAESDALKGALALTQHLLRRLNLGRLASGLWHAGAVAAGDIAEAEVAQAELAFRMQGIERAARLRAGELPASDAERLDHLCDGLAAVAR